MNSHVITLLIGISCMVAGVISVVQANKAEKSPECNNRTSQLAMAGIAFLVNGIILVSTGLYCLYFKGKVTLLQYLVGVVGILFVSGMIFIGVKNEKKARA